jgi:hypothetical protein
MREKMGQEAANGLGIQGIFTGSFWVRFSAVEYFQQHGWVRLFHRYVFSAISRLRFRLRLGSFFDQIIYYQ